VPYVKSSDQTSLFVTEWGSGPRSSSPTRGDCARINGTTRSRPSPTRACGACSTTGATLRVYPGAGHGLYASDHQTLNADILAFIRETPTARPAVTPAGAVV
jgi:hypothetical protein